MGSPYDQFTLSEALILAAAEDYKKALIRRKHHPEDREARLVCRRLERYFRGPAFEEMTTIDPEYLIQKMRRVVMEDDHL